MTKWRSKKASITYLGHPSRVYWTYREIYLIYNSSQTLEKYFFIFSFASLSSYFLDNLRIVKVLSVFTVKMSRTGRNTDTQFSKKELDQMITQNS